MSDDKRPPRSNKPYGERPKSAAPRKPYGTDSTAKKPFVRGDSAPFVQGETSERIAKRLARAGISSRRDAELLIADGRVTVNGKVLTSPAVNVTASDRITVGGQELPAIERTRLWLYHKRAGLVTTSRDPEGRKTVFEVLPEGMPRVISVGRLDINTEGLLLLTNDGGLARALELPTTGWLRRYRVRAFGKITQIQLDKLKDGISVDGIFYGAIDAQLEREQGSNVWITLGLREGKNREVKNILGSLGLNVNRLIRISFGPFQLGELAEGSVLEIKGRILRDQLGDKLIEESGANFDADVVNDFSNRPVRSTESRAERAGFAPRPGRGGVEERPAPRVEGEWVGGTDNPIVSRRKREEVKRFDALDRLDTKSGKGNRGVNVWTAPGSRPRGSKALEKTHENRSDKPDRSDNRSRAFRNRADKPAAPEGERKPRREGFKPRTEAPSAPVSEGRPRREGFKPFAERQAAPSSDERAPRREGFKPRTGGPRAPSGEGKPRREGFKPSGKPSFAKDGKPAPRGPRPAGGGGGYKGKPGNADRRR